MEGSTRGSGQGARGGLLLVAALALGVAAGAWWFSRDPAAPQDPAAQQRLAALVESWRSRAPDPAALPELDRGFEAAAAGHGRTALDVALDRLALDPDEVEARLALVAWSARWPTLSGLSDADLELLLAQARARAPKHSRLPGAEAWLGLARGDLAGARAALDAAPPAPARPAELLAATARLRLAREGGADPGPAALALHAADPRDVEGCEGAARAGLAAGDLMQAQEVIDACLAAGVQHPPLSRLQADLLDLAGEAAEACAAYQEAGALLHAATIQLQEGACARPLSADDLARALALPLPEARLLATWQALASGDLAALAALVPVLEALPTADGPPFRAARAAALLRLDRAEEALGALGELSGAPAQVLRARALSRLGRAEEAGLALERAVAQEPWNLDLHRERVALQRGGDPRGALEALASTDPIALALASLEPDRLSPWTLLAPDPWPRPETPEQASLLGALDPALPVPALPGSVEDPRVLRALLARRLLQAEAAAPAELSDLVEGLGRAMPEDPVAQALIGAALAELGRGEEADARLADVATGEVEPVALLWARANRALDRGDAAGALAAAERLVLAWPELPGTRAFRYAIALQARSSGPGRGPPGP